MAPGPDRIEPLRRPLAVAVIAVLIAATAVAVVIAANGEQRDADRAQAALARQAGVSTRTTLERSVGGLFGAQALADDAGRVDLSRFQAYARGLLRHRDTYSVGYQVAIRHAERAALERRLGVELTTVTGDGDRPAPRRDRYLVMIDSLSPTGPPTVGLDVAGDPLRAALADRVRDSAMPELGPPIRFLRSSEQGLVALAPLYRRTARLGTVAQRRRAFAGTISLAFRSSDVGRLVADQLPRGARLRIADGTQVIAGPRGSMPDATRVMIPVAGRRWSIEVRAPSGASPWPSIGVGVTGLLVTILVALTFFLAGRREREARARLAAEQEARVAEEDRRRRAEQLADARERVARLQRVPSALARALTTPQVARALAEEGRVALAARSALVLVTERGGLAVMHVAGHDDPAGRPAVGLAAAAGSRMDAAGFAEWSVDAERDSGRRWPVEPIDGSSPLARAVASGEPKWLSGGGVEPLARSLLGCGAAAVLPIAVAGRRLGALVLCFEQPDPLTAEQREDARTIATVAASALARAGRYETEHDVAQTLQRSLLPDEGFTHDGVTVGARYLSAAEGVEAGGDWWDAVALPGGRVALTVGDVVGKGAGAAAVMGQLRAALRAAALDGAGPAEALGRLSMFADTVPGGQAATALVALVDFEAGILRYACAGHPPPLLVEPDGDTNFLEDGRGLPLATLSSERRYTEASVPLVAGARLVLYTDGAIERRGEPIDAGLRRIADAVAAIVREHRDIAADALCQSLLERVVPVAGAADDVALVVAAVGR